MNYNLRCERHLDKGNSGPSQIISFGKFRGGRLLLEDEGGGNAQHVSCYRKFVHFNGATQPHETEAIQWREV